MSGVSTLKVVKHKLTIAGKVVHTLNGGRQGPPGATPGWIYEGTYPSHPTTRPDGSAIQAGDRYVNSTDKLEYIFVSNAWSSGINAAQLAQQWATKIDAEVVVGQGFGAKKYSNDSATQAGVATTQAGIATSKATEAGNYAAAAASGAKFYDTIALGRSGVADTQTFGVKAGGSDGLARPTVYRRDSAGTQTPLYSVLPASEYDAGRSGTLRANFVVTDADGNEAVRVLKTLDLQEAFAVNAAGGFSTKAIELAPSKSLRFRWCYTDVDGNVQFGVDSSGRMVGNGAIITNRTPYKTGGSFDYDVIYAGIYGQSLTVGQARPAISRVASAINLMFPGGLRPQYDNIGNTDAVNYGSFVPALEADSAVVGTLGETPCMGYGDMALQLLAIEYGLTSPGCQFLLSAPGFGATTLAGLSKGTTHYNRVITQVTYGFNNALALNKSFGVPTMKVEHGESDYVSGTTQAAYLALFKQLRLDFDADIRAVVVTQTKAVRLVAMQLSSHKVGGSATPTIARAQKQASVDDPLIHIAAPMYMLEYQDSNNFHLVSWASRMMGAYLRLCEARVIVDGAVWKPLQALSWFRQGKLVYIKFNVPVGRLVLDTDLVALNTNYGFELVDNLGNPITITNVGLIGTDTVKLTAAANVPAGASWRYAWSGAGNVGNLVGPRGNLRDQQGENIPGHEAITFDGRPMHNWCLHDDGIL